MAREFELGGPDTSECFHPVAGRFEDATPAFRDTVTKDAALSRSSSSAGRSSAVARVHAGSSVLGRYGCRWRSNASVDVHVADHTPVALALRPKER